MPIEGICQPEWIDVDEKIRLRKYDGHHEMAFNWYQDKKTVHLVDGNDEPYTKERLKKMYDYLDQHGELYFIEIKKDGGYVPIGDVTFWQNDMPIVIGERSYRGKKIGQRVINRLVQRGKSLGYDTLYVQEIYDDNIGSRKCFESVGFRAYQKTAKGSRYRLSLKEGGKKDECEY